MSMRMVMIANKSVYLEPIDTPSTGLIVARVALKHLHHETLASIFYALLQEHLNLFGTFSIG